MARLQRWRKWLALLCGLPFAMVISGCSQIDRLYISRGIGTDLDTSDESDTTARLDAYVLDICKQAGFAQQGQAADSCALDPIYSPDWLIFVQAGMNDIDRRCDGYLQWLDDKRRSTQPIISQIGDTETATTAILTLSKVGLPAIGIVGAAFGLTRATFTNYSSRLILEIDHSTVQSVVLKNQNDFRSQVLTVGAKIDNRAAAIYVLRSYLRICTPFTIETSINTTLQTYSRGGPGALASWRAPTLVAPSNVVRTPAQPPIVAAQPPRLTDAKLAANCKQLEIQQKVVDALDGQPVTAGTQQMLDHAKSKIAQLQKANGGRTCSEVGL